MVNDVSTRWNSTYEMFCRLLLIRESVNNTLRRASDYDELHIKETIDVPLIRDFINVMFCFEQATKVLSLEKSETASIIQNLFITIKIWLTSNNSKISIKTCEGKLLQSALVKSFDFYMKKYQIFDSNLLKAATFIDPRLYFKIKKKEKIYFI